VTWPPPELDVGVDDGELRPDDELPDEFDVLDPLLDELELLEPELVASAYRSMRSLCR
jgi:hypothetical protein